MSRLLTQNLSASGVASCIVVLNDEAASSMESVRRLEGHFTQSDLSQDAALSRAMGRPEPEAGNGAVQYYENLGVFYGTVDRGGLAALRKERAVASVSAAPQLSLIRPDRIGGAALATPRTWGIDALGVPALWDEGITGDGVVVGHLDTGADGKHPALVDAIKSFAEFDSFGRKVTPAPKAHDTDQHGTHTAATIAGREVAGQHVGVAPGAKLASAIVIEGGQVIARVLGAVAECCRSLQSETRDQGRAVHPGTTLRRSQLGRWIKPRRSRTSRRASASHGVATRWCPTSWLRGSTSSPQSPGEDSSRWTAARWPLPTSRASRRCSFRHDHGRR
jgi:Subtilase family